MLAARSCLKNRAAENEPRRTLLLFGLTPAHGVSGGKGSAGTFLHCDPDRLLLPIISDVFTTADELSNQETASAVKDLN